MGIKVDRRTKSSGKLRRAKAARETWQPSIAATRRPSADGDRLAAEVRIVPLLDRRVEGIHVDVNDFPLSVFVHCTLVSLQPSRREP
jgi:hypothetical protein